MTYFKTTKSGNRVFVRNEQSEKWIVDIFRGCETYKDVSQITGVSYNTIQRICVKHKVNKGQGNKTKGRNEPNRKITDEELLQEAKKFSAFEISQRHNMSVERVARRASALGVKLDWKGTHHHWLTRAKRYRCDFIDESITLDELIVRDCGICQICGLAIDLEDIKDGHIRSLYPTLDHIIPLSKGGSHTWDNVQLAHMKCNAQKGTKLITV